MSSEAVKTDPGDIASSEEALCSRNRVAILDGGSQFGGLIDRNVRELGVQADLLPLDTPPEELTAYGAVILSGGPKSVHDKDAPHCDPAIFESGLPILGICYGMQEITYQLGGRVAAGNLREDGVHETVLFGLSRLFQGMRGTQQVLMSHGDSVVEPPPGFFVTGGADDMISVIEHPGKRIFVTQFHPEVFQTEHGTEIFANFLFGIAGLEADYTAEDQIEEAITHLRSVIQDRPVLMLLSGGVDSSVAGSLVEQAVETPVFPVHFDTGFGRAGESEAVVAAFRTRGVEVELLDRTHEFLNATAIRDDGSETPRLCEVTSPKDKRRIIGNRFVEECQAYMAEHGIAESCVIVQGTLRPDLIESGSHLASSRADTIKEHHNDTPLVRTLRAQGRVADPLQRLYKDQVREIGRQLGLPPEFVDRHPFPGPGLAVRILCAREPYRLEQHERIQNDLDNLVTASGRGHDFRAHLLPVQTVGVQGDARSYKYLVGIEGQQDWNSLFDLSRLITNNIHEVNRACYVFGDIDRSSLGITETLLRPSSINQVRHADAIATQLLTQDGLMPKISQMPVISFPVHFGEAGKRSIALRPFVTPDFMTGIAARPGKHLPERSVLEMVSRISSEVPDIARVVYDITAKPPGTTEWE